MSSIVIRELEAGAALAWYKKSWILFKKRPGLFFLQFIIFYLLQVLVQLLGPLSTFGSNILWCLLAAGFFYACDKINKGEELSFGDFFKGFSKSTKPLVVLGLYLSAFLFIYIIFTIVMVIMIGGLSIFNYLNNVQAMADYFMSNILIGIFILVLVLLIPMTVLLMASLFSPALVFFHNLKPRDAIKKSLIACAYNSMAFSMHGFWFLLFSVLALIPLGLGFFILFPVVHITIYFAYRDIFEAPPVSLINS